MARDEGRRPRSWSWKRRPAQLAHQTPRRSGGEPKNGRSDGSLRWSLPCAASSWWEGSSHTGAPKAQGNSRKTIGALGLRGLLLSGNANRPRRRRTSSTSESAGRYHIGTDTRRSCDLLVVLSPGAHRWGGLRIYASTFLFGRDLQRSYSPHRAVAKRPSYPPLYFPRRSLSALVNGGRIWKRSPTAPNRASLKIGASASRLMATMVFAVRIPAWCWIAPEMPQAI